VDAARLKHRARVFDDMDVMPGVREIMLEGAARGWRIGVASSSPMSWVFGHLRSHGLDAWVETMRTGEDGVPLKPAPDLYQLACRDLGADPARSLAFEDSATGVRAALAAGLHVIAVPNRITQHHDLSGAHSVVKSLQGFRLPA
jgi:putative hydrolase of the HAD superfamily